MKFPTEKNVVTLTPGVKLKSLHQPVDWKKVVMAKNNPFYTTSEAQTNAPKIATHEQGASLA